MNLIKNSKLLIVLLIILLVSLSGCDARLEKGEDLTITNHVEAEIIKMNLTYIKDQKGNCFAVLNNKTDGFRNTFTMAKVNCESLAN